MIHFAPSPHYSPRVRPGCLWSCTGGRHQHDAGCCHHLHVQAGGHAVGGWPLQGPRQDRCVHACRECDCFLCCTEPFFACKHVC